MGRKRKLLESIRRNPQDVRFDDALKAAEYIGFTKKGGSGSHQTRARPGEPTQLNFQEANNGKAKPYQVRQLILMIDRYENNE